MRKITIAQAKERLREAHDELYYRKEIPDGIDPKEYTGYHYGVRNLPLLERILLFEEIEGLRNFLKKHDGKGIQGKNTNR